jgi:hypothetical protein
MVPHCIHAEEQLQNGEKNKVGGIILRDAETDHDAGA